MLLIQTFNEKMASLLDVPRDLTDEEIEALGARDPEAAAEDFIEANIQKRTSKKKPYVLHLLSMFHVLGRLTLRVVLGARSFGFVLCQTRSFVSRYLFASTSSISIWKRWRQPKRTM